MASHWFRPFFSFFQLLWQRQIKIKEIVMLFRKSFEPPICDSIFTRAIGEPQISETWHSILSFKLALLLNPHGINGRLAVSNWISRSALVPGDCELKRRPFQRHSIQVKGLILSWIKRMCWLCSDIYGQTMLSSRIRIKHRRPTLTLGSSFTILTLFWFIWDVKDPTL